MLTVDVLRAWGADTEDGLRRCLNNEAFYLRLVDKAVKDPSFDRLKEAVEGKDLEKGFEYAHALKGVMANLALTPILNPVMEITELLRARTNMDYTALITEILAQRDALLKLL
jgi:hypothetical protein